MARTTSRNRGSRSTESTAIRRELEGLELDYDTLRKTGEASWRPGGRYYPWLHAKTLPKNISREIDKYDAEVAALEAKIADAKARYKAARRGSVSDEAIALMLVGAGATGWILGRVTTNIGR